MAKFESFSSHIVYKGKSPEPTTLRRNKLDVVNQDVKVYIEGVQVPFISIYVTQVYGQVPTATLEIPPASGLLDIVRGYQPKVHIFYEDLNYGDYRLLFWGHISNVSYSRRRSGGGGSNIIFNCLHKNTLVAGFTMDFVDWSNPQGPTISDPAITNQGAGVKMNSFNSPDAIIQALQGIDGVASEEERIISANATPENLGKLPLNKVDTTLENIVQRLYGMPGVAINLWNQVKKAGYDTDLVNLAMTNMWSPLTEEGLSYFKRMSGHPLLEWKLQTGKANFCHKGTSEESKILVAPVFRQPNTSAVQTEFAYNATQNALSFQHELTSYSDLLRAIYEISQYDVLTLASPAEVAADPAVQAREPWTGGIDLMAVETIIKPKMPFYFSPVCNVIFPKMYHSFQISQDEMSVPTRLSSYYDAIPGLQSAAVNFRGPPSVREAVAYNNKLVHGKASGQLSLSATTQYSYSIPAKYEQGVGIRPLRITMPWWLSQVVAEKASTSSGQVEQQPLTDSEEYQDMMLLAKDWEVRYGQVIQMNDGAITRKLDPLKAPLNIYDPNIQDIRPYERLMYSTVDYEYSTKMAASRVGTVECLFNPYVIPGYPMDVIDDSPNHPSFHGFCTSVSHSVTPRGMSTTIGMASAMTYAEISNYYIPPVPPFLRTALDLVNGERDAAKATGPADLSAYKNIASTLIQNPKAKATADTFYQQVLGVGAAAPDDLIHFSSGRAYPVERENGLLKPLYAPSASGIPEYKHNESNPFGANDYDTSVGNIRMVSRPIESKTSIEYKFKLKFIDLNRDMYNGTQVNYLNPLLASNLFLEPGASLFLDYMEVEEFIDVKK